MKERSMLPALIEVLDGGWDFTVSVAVARKEDGMQVREMDESTQHLAEAHTGTVGKKREEEDRSTVGKGTRLGQLAEQWSGEVVKRLRMLPGGHVERTGRQWETVGLQRLSVQIQKAREQVVLGQGRLVGSKPSQISWMRSGPPNI